MFCVLKILKLPLSFKILIYFSYRLLFCYSLENSIAKYLDPEVIPLKDIILIS